MLPGIEEKHRRLISETRVFQKEVEANFGVLPTLRAFAATAQPVSPNLQNKQQIKPEMIFPQTVYGSYDNTGAGVMLIMDLNDDGNYSWQKSFLWYLAYIITYRQKYNKIILINICGLVYVHSRAFRVTIFIEILLALHFLFQANNYLDL